MQFQDAIEKGVGKSVMNVNRCKSVVRKSNYKMVLLNKKEKRRDCEEKVEKSY